MKTSALVRSLLACAALAALTGPLAACGGTGSTPDEAGGQQTDEGGDELGGQVASGSKVETTAKVNLRTGPSTSQKIIETLPKGTTLTIVKSTPTAGFYQVDHDGTTGWVSGKYIAIVEDADAPTPGGSGGGNTAAACGVDLTDFQPPTSCNGPSGFTSKQKPSNGVYASSWFGCYNDSNGDLHTDPNDNCVFACSASKYCSEQGPECQAKLKWFSADADRFGCGARVRVTNCNNGKSVVLVALDRGPNCSSIEKAHSASVIDMSHDAMGYLFDGKFYGGGDHKAVVVEPVDASTPLGPVSAAPAPGPGPGPDPNPNPGPNPDPGTKTLTLPPANAMLDYQLGGAYTLPKGVGIVSRDRTAPIAPGAYNICYVNGFQAQPGDESFWLNDHPDLVLRDDSGQPVIDADWNELILDVSTAAKRAALAEIVGGWVDGCASDGFDAVEIDNLDTFSRSGGRLSEDDAVATIALFAARAHARGLAIAQKNSAEIVGRRAEMGTDFAVTEECNAFSECDVYTGAYGDHVLVIEYDKANFTKGCSAYPQLSIVLRDKNLSTPGTAGYVRSGC